MYTPTNQAPAATASRRKLHCIREDFARSCGSIWPQTAPGWPRALRRLATSLGVDGGGEYIFTHGKKLCIFLMKIPSVTIETLETATYVYSRSRPRSTAALSRLQLMAPDSDAFRAGAALALGIVAQRRRRRRRQRQRRRQLRRWACARGARRGAAMVVRGQVGRRGRAWCRRGGSAGFVWESMGVRGLLIAG